MPPPATAAAPPVPRPRRRGPWLRVAASLGLMVAILLWVQPHSLAAAFSAPHPLWLAAALALSVPQVALSAWRWRLTAARLGAPLPLGVAVREYYLATFLNQILPGGVMGDAARAWRHARSPLTSTSGSTASSLPLAETSTGATAAWHAVLIERASGQLALLAVVLATLAGSPELQAATARLFAASASATAAGSTFATPTRAAALALALALLGTLGGVALWRARSHIARLRKAVQASLLARAVFVRQLVASLLIVASYVGVYLCCARMIGIDTPTASLAPLVPWVLLAMAIPLSIAGWGVREGAAALVWQVAGLDPAQGVAISIAYGVVILLSSLPGALVLLRRPAMSR